MKIITIKPKDGERYEIGYQGDHNVNKIVFDIEGEGDYYLKLQLKETEYEPIPIPDKEFTITSTYTQEQCTYDAQILEKDELGDYRKNSPVFKLSLKKSIEETDNVKEVVPPNFKNAYDSMVEITNQIKEAFENGDFNGNGIVSIEKESTRGLTDTYKIIFSDGKETKFNVTNGKGIVSIEKTNAQENIDTYTITFNDETTSTFTVTNGIDGYSPKVSITQEIDGATIEVTDKEGTTKAKVLNGTNGKDGNDGTDGKDGIDGTTPNIQIGTVTTLEPDQNATVERTGDNENPIFNFGIPRGKDSDVQQEVEDIRVGYDGKTYANAGEAVRKQVSSLKEDLGDLDGAVFNVTQEFKDYTSDATILSDKFVCVFMGGDERLLTSINDGEDICDCYVISVNENDKFQVRGSVYNDNLYYPLIVMSSASFTDNSIEESSLVTAENGNYSYWGTGNPTEIYEFVIPKGVKTLLVNKFYGESEFLLKKLVDVKKSKIPTKISELENDTLFLSREMYMPQYNIYTGQIRGSDDFLPVYDVKDDGAYQVTEMISVSKGDKIYYSGHFYSFPAVALYDELGTFVSDLSKNLRIYTTYNDVEVGEVTQDGFVAAYSYKKIGGNNVKLALNVYGNKAKNEVKSCYRMNYLYVATTGNDESGDGSASNPFASIYHANEIIHSNSPRNRFTIIVKNGTYTDLQERYSGIGSSGVYQGVKTKPYVYYQSETPERPDLCVIKWDGATGLTTPCNLSDVDEKAPFHVCGELLPFCMHTKIKGFTFDCKNTRYAAHIEMAGATLENEWSFENCIFKFEGRPDITNDSNKTAPVVGIGSGFSENGMFKNCIFENLQIEYNQAINVHDNKIAPNDITPYMLKGFTYTIDGCLFKSCNLIGLASIHQDTNNYDIDNMLYIKHCSGVDTVNANENMKYKFIDI